ncbi:MAG: hypothetical protein KDB03_09940 [Planctomycetales bacterium]|nr:hypothetical protein [Planctomycetales bacterium]
MHRNINSILFAVVLSIHFGPYCLAQQRVVRVENGAVIEGEVPANAARPAPQPPNKPPETKPNSPDSQKPADKENASNKPADDANAPVKRGAEPPSPPDPDEFNVRPTPDGTIQFQFRNQPWPDLLRWLASVSNLSLDWQELPNDYLNIATQRPYTLFETRNLINRHLLVRGYTMLEHEGVLSVAKIDALNPAFVPRVRPEDLADQQPHYFVRTSFPLSWLIAEEVVEEFKSMLSPNGKLTALAATNRLEAMDAATNLLDIHRLLEQEQSAIALENLAKEFILSHARASQVKEQLEAFLGIQRSAGGGSMSSDSMRMMQQQFQQQMQQMQQQMQQAQANKGGAAPGRARRPEEVYLVANERSNSVIVHAPPDKMAIIAAFIARVDVANENFDLQRLETRMKVFRLASLSPAELVASLNAMDVLDPTTRLQVDEKNNAIIAYASVADQYLIQSVIDRLDGSERRFEVIPLRRLEAESVAGSIRFLMGADEEESDSNNRRSSYYYYDYYSYRNNNSESRKKDKMRVGANSQDNQLLLWVNDIELEEVENLLVKLGEIPPASGNLSTTRVVDASRQPETYEYLKRLKEQWDRVSPVPLKIPEASEFENNSEVSPSPADQPSQTNQAQENDISPKDEITSAQRPSPFLTSTGLQQTSGNHSDSTNTQPSNTTSNASQQTSPLAGVSILIDEGGNLVLHSDDTAALDKLEEWMQVNRPPRKPYDIFKVKYARASWVSLNLEDYFKDKQDDERPRFYSFFLDDRQDDKKDQQLGKKPPLRFIWDNDTNSIVVQGADDIDRKTIKELIELWDVPEPVDETGIRFTRLVRIQYSRADAIVNTLKEAYRDLLSANDKAFQQQAGGDRNSSSTEEKWNNNGGGVTGGGMSFSFKGKLSLGPDPITNSVLVSAEGKPLLELVCDMIKELDEAARPEGSLEVVTLSPQMNNKSLEKALRALLQSPNSQQPQSPQGEQPQQPAEQNQPGNGGINLPSAGQRVSGRPSR